MWSSDRRKFLALLAVAPAAACGFSPAMAPGGAAHALRGAVTFQEPRDQWAFHLVSQLENRLGRSTAPRFRLTYGLQLQPVGAAVTPSGSVNRFSLTGRANYALISEATGQTVTSGTVQSFTSWATTGTTQATVSSREDAYRRLTVILADQIVTRLIAAAPK